MRYPSAEFVRSWIKDSVTSGNLFGTVLYSGISRFRLLFILFRGRHGTLKCIFSNQSVRTSTIDGVHAVDIVGNADRGHIDFDHVDFALPPVLTFFTLNILLVLLIIMVALNTAETLNFSSFPTNFVATMSIGLNGVYPCGAAGRTSGR